MASQAEIHLHGLGFPEGPVALDDGSIAFVDLLHQNIRVYRDGKAREICAIEGSPNGMRRGPDGGLYITNNGGIAPVSLHQLKLAEPQVSGRIQKIGLDGSCRDVVTRLPGKGPWRPNDLIFTPDGQIVFTDPQNWEEVKDWKVEGRIPGYGGGRLYLASLDGKARHLIDIYGFTNGLAFHPDGSLIVGLSILNQIVRLPWYGDQVGTPEIWCQFDDGTAPDGMLFHDGRLYVAGSVGDRIAVLDSAGRVLERIETGPGSDPTNLCVHDGRLWVTLGLPGQLVSYRL
jgi:sugar lactone lactonase YvrE